MTGTDPTATPVTVDQAPRLDPLWQALVRAARFILTTVISSVIVVLPQLIGIFTLDPAVSGFLVLFLGGLLQGLGKYLRGATVQVGGSTILAGGAADVPEATPTAPDWANKLPI